MVNSELINADDVNVSVSTNNNLPEGWTLTHQEQRKPIDDIDGYYI